MTRVEIHTLRCDASDREGRPLCHASLDDDTPRELRRQAKRLGWLRRVDGYDYCPDHAYDDKPSPRGTCTGCGKDRMVRRDGTIGRHIDMGTRSADQLYCPGVGKPPKEDR